MKDKINKILKSFGNGIIDALPVVSTFKNAIIKKQTPNTLFTKLDVVRLITNVSVFLLIIILIIKKVDCEILEKLINFLIK